MTYSNERTVQFPGSEGRFIAAPAHPRNQAEARAASSAARPNPTPGRGFRLGPVAQVVRAHA
jgi:hypothetical protein